MKSLLRSRRAKIFAVGVVLLALLLGGWLVWRSLQPAGPTAEQVEAVNRDIAGAMMSLNGELIEYDASEEIFEIRVSDGDAQTMRLADTATITRGIAAEEIELQDIPVGETISVSYTGGDKALAIWWDDESSASQENEE